MYAALYRRLPGKTAAKLVALTVILTIVVLLLWFVVFPLIGSGNLANPTI